MLSPATYAVKRKAAGNDFPAASCSSFNTKEDQCLWYVPSRRRRYYSVVSFGTGDCTVGKSSGKNL